MASEARPQLLILGTRGVPAAHGGFETFAERLATHLAARDWHVTVYGQMDVAVVRRPIVTDRWNGIDRVQVEVSGGGPRATLTFDWTCVRDAARRPGVCLVLGYNSASFLAPLRWRGRKIITNMDGIEWRRLKWPPHAKAWLWANEAAAIHLSDRLVADHPAIAAHLAARGGGGKTVTIPYGGDPIAAAPIAPLVPLGLEPDRYLVSIARIEPDNSILPIVEAFSRRPRRVRLMVLGRLDETNPYHRAVHAAGSADVLFPGAIYDPAIVRALRFHARAYCHGHRVGGTNPSLVEALWAGNAVIAHRNPFNLWTAGPEQFFFDDADGFERQLGRVLGDEAAVRAARGAARARAAALFAWEPILARYEAEIARLGGYPITAAPVADEALARASRSWALSQET